MRLPTGSRFETQKAERHTGYEPKRGLTEPCRTCSLRRRRAEEAEDTALEQLENELQEEPLEIEALAEVTTLPEMGDKTVALEELPKVQDEEPLGTPQPLGPREVVPLLTPKQMKELEASQATASHLYGGPRVLQGLGPGEELPRPKFLEGERLKAVPPMESTATGTPSPVDFATLLKGEENAPLLKMVMGLYTENQKLKQEAELRGGHGGPRGPAGRS